MNRKVYNIHDAMKHKNSDTAIFLGSGSSINDISPYQWKILKQFDLWTVNNWVYHPFIVPDFYHLELKAYGFPIVKKRLEEKKLLYKDTKFIVPEGKCLVLSNGQKVMTLDAIPLSCVVHTYPWINYKTTERKDIKADYKIEGNVIHRSYGMSFPSILEIVYRFGYERIVLFGVDLDNSFYFWTGGDPKYGKVHHQTNKAHENKDPNQPHSTFRVVDFIKDFNVKFMKSNMYVGTKKSMLYPGLNFIEIERL